MTEKYDLQALIEDPDLFDQRVNEYAIEMLEALDIHGALIVEANELAKAGYENLRKQDIDPKVYEMLLMPYVRKHFFTTFTTSVHDWQRQKMIERYSDSPCRLGDQYELIIDRYGQAAIEIVTLDEDTLDINEAQLVYRYNDRETKEGWVVGTIVDAVNECMARRDL